MSITKYGFGTLGDKLITECCKRKPDMQIVQELIDSGAPINLAEKRLNYATILSRVFDYYNNTQSGKYLPIIAQIFIDNGFNTKKYGADCIFALIFSTYDKYIIDAAKRLLHAGVSARKKTWEMLLEGIGTEESYQHCCQRDLACENIYYAFYELVEAAYKGTDFEGISSWQDCIGCKIDSIISFPKAEKSLEKITDCSYLVNDAVIFRSGGKVIVVEGRPNIYLKTSADRSSEQKPEDLSEELSIYIERTITNIQFSNREYKRSDSIYAIPIIEIIFDSGAALTFTNNQGEVGDNSISNTLEIKTSVLNKH